MTAEDIYRQLLEHGAEIGLATVYRVLTQFEAAGLVLKHNFEGGQAVYELDRGGHHDHMVDVDSGKIIEFESHEIEELQRKIAADHGYELEEHSLVLYVRKKRNRSPALTGDACTLAHHQGHRGLLHYLQQALPLCIAQLRAGMQDAVHVEASIPVTLGA
ncbi:hypothetical protein G6F60_014131 [Rhizopus arrhizus]|nr:hypothetical protein G6F60_014131 [Rhizopus arrhizus]